MTLKDLVLYIIIIIIVIIYDYVRILMIRNSPVPKAVLDFPVYETTEEEYNSLKKEIEPFFLDAVEDQRSELSLTAKQLNCLFTRGITPIKGKGARSPLYYEIENNKLIEKGLSYPCTDSIAGYLITVRVTEFSGTMCSSELISVNGFPPPSDNSGSMIFPLKDLPLLYYLCNFDGKRMDLLAKKITTVEIVDDKLIMRI